MEDLTCCRKKVIDDSRLIEVMDRNDEPEDYLEYDNPDVPIVDAATMDSMVEDYFERPGSHTSKLSSRPAGEARIRFGKTCS